MSVDAAMQLMELAGGDRFAAVRAESEIHQGEHGCGLHHGGAPQMQLVAARARAVGVTRALDLGSGLGYSTLWIASAIAPTGSVIGIDDDPAHTSRATEIAADFDIGARVRYATGRVRDVLTGEPRDDWNTFAGPNWAEDTFEYARLLALRNDIHVTWVTTPPIAFATNVASTLTPYRNS